MATTKRTPARTAAAVAKPPLIYLFYGSERGLMLARVEEIRSAVLDPAMEAFNHDRLAGADLEGPGRVLEACLQLPMLSKQRLVELADPEAIGKARGNTDPKLLDRLLDYIAAPNPSTVLVITSSTIDGRSRLVKAAEKSAAAVVERCDKLTRDDVAYDFVLGKARERGIRLADAAASELVDRVGTSPSALLVALDQVSIYAGQGRAISRDDVEAVVVDVREALIYALMDAVGTANAELAIVELRQMLGDGKAPLQVLAMLYSQLKKLFVAQAAGSVADVERAAGVPNFVARKLIAQASNFDSPRLIKAFKALAQLDTEFKGGSIVAQREPAVALERWVLDLCGVLPAAAAR